MLEIRDLEKSYGKCKIFDKLSFSIEEKGIYGILMSGGSGKTTLANLLCGCTYADNGEIFVEGEILTGGNCPIKKRIRLIPQKLVLQKTVTPMEYLSFVGDALGIEPEKKYRQIKEALELTELVECQSRLFSALSIEQGFRLSLAAALIGNPACIVIDNAFLGMSDSSIKELRSLVAILGQLKTIILISSDPSQIRTLCENVFILSNGKVAISGKISEIEEKINSTHQTYVSVRGDGDLIIRAISSVDGVASAKIMATEKNNVISVSVEHRPDDRIKDKLFSALAAIDAPMLSVRSVTLTIEDVFYSFVTLEKAKKEPCEEADIEAGKTERNEKK